MVSPLGPGLSTVTLTTSGTGTVTYSGTITIGGIHGTVTASLSGQVSGSSAQGASVDLTYTITGGTGAFAGATGTGAAVLQASTTPTGAQSYTLTFGNTA
jgi:hypothetical protein